MGICKFNDDDKIVYLDSVLPRVTPEQIKANTGFLTSMFPEPHQADPILVR